MNRLSAMAALTALAAALAGCSFQRTSADIVGDAISGGGTSFSGDDDPELIREALPFGLKSYESLLDVTPDHRGLLLSSARGFAVYAYLVQRDGDGLGDGQLAKKRAIEARARKLFLRGRDYALRGLEVKHPGIGGKLRKNAATALSVTNKDDVPFLYWAGAAWGGALSAAKDDLNLIAELPLAGALVGRVLALDEGFDHGAAHEFFISYEAGRPGGSAAKARRHYTKALKMSAGRRASVHVALAEAVSVPEQKLKEFRQMLAKVLAYDVDAYRPLRLSNVLAQSRARWLKTRTADLFLDANPPEAIK
jgi:predicted anti-sigma-YlaC factor YlaD